MKFPFAFWRKSAPPATIEELFGASLAHLWDSYSNATGVFTDRIGGFDVDDGGDFPPAEEDVNGHSSPVFDGTGGTHALQSTDDFTTLNGSDTWTMFGAVRIDGGDAYGSIIQRQAAFYVEFNSGSGGTVDGSLAITISNGGGSFINGSTSVEDGAWHRWILTCNAGVMRLYVDGELDGQDLSTAPMPDDIENPLFIGRQFGSAMPGCLSIVGIATRAVNPTEVALLDAMLEAEYTESVVGGGAPTVVGISPAFGHVAGGRHVVIEVDDSTGCTGASVGGVALTGFAIDDATHVSGDVGAHAAGAVDVTVTNAFGTSSPLVGAFTYLDPASSALHLIEPGNYNAATPLWTATVGFSPNASFTGAPPASGANDPDFSAHDLAGGAGDTIDDFFVNGALSRSGFAVATIDSSNAGGGVVTPWANQHLWTDHTYGGIGLCVFDDGVDRKAVFWFYTGSVTYTTSAPITFGVRHTIEWRYTFDGASGFIQIGVDGVWQSPVAITDDVDPGLVGKRFKFGTNYSGAGDLDGRIHGHALYSVDQSDEFFEAMAAHYG